MGILKGMNFGMNRQNIFDRACIEFYHIKTRQDKTRQDKTRQGKARQGKARQGKARQGKKRKEKTITTRFIIYKVHYIVMLIIRKVSITWCDLRN